MLSSFARKMEEKNMNSTGTIGQSSQLLPSEAIFLARRAVVLANEMSGLPSEAISL